MNEPIERRIADGVLELVMARPDKKNALTGAMYEALTAALAEADREPAIGAVLISGAGGDFTAGNDIADFLARAQSGGALAALTFVGALARCETPLVAAVDGVAVGIGTTMLFHCDLVYATARARFRMPFVDLGLVPEAGSSLLAPQRVGMARAAQWLMLGDPFDAAEAHRVGLVGEIVAPEALLDHARAQARRLAAKPRAALAATRRLMRGDRGPLLARIDEEAAAFARALTSAEARAAFTAFMTKSAAKH